MINAKRLKERIAAANKIQADVAREIGVSPQAVSKLVSGETQETSKLYQIARFLKTTPEYLTDESDEPTAANSLVDPADNDDDNDEDSVEVDEIDLRFGMGAAYLDTPVNVEKRRFSRAWLRSFTHSAPHHLVWTHGDGDSMDPTIRSGEVILIDKSQRNPRMGDGIWALTFGEVGMIKRLRPMPDGTVKIFSDNQLVPPELATDGELYVIGRVVAVMRRL